MSHNMDIVTIESKNIILIYNDDGKYYLRSKDNDDYEHEQRSIVEFIETIIDLIPIDRTDINKMLDFISEVDCKVIKNNINIFSNDLHLNYTQIRNIFRLNPELLTYDIYDAFEIYSYMIDEKILSVDQINQLLFHTSLTSSKEPYSDFLRFLQYYLLNEINPNLKILLQKFSPSNKVEIRDRLEYIKVMRILEKKPVTKKSFEEARMILNASLFDTIVRKDNEEIKGINPSYESDTIFPGIKMALYRELEGLQQGFFDEFWQFASLGDKNPIFKNFYDNLTFKNYLYPDNSRTIQEATYLKNEIVGKITYTHLLFEEILPNHKPNMMELLSESPKSLKSSSYIVHTRLKEDKTSDRPELDDKIIREMLRINPYTFDMFRNIQSGETKELTPMEVRYCHIALKNGYIFSPEELEEYDKLSRRTVSYIQNPEKHPLTAEELSYYFRISDTQIEYTDGSKEIVHDTGIVGAKGNSRKVNDYRNDCHIPIINDYEKDFRNYTHTINHILQYINNKIEIPKISPENKTEYVKQVRELIKQYIFDRNNESTSKEKLTDGMFELLRAIDLYLRSNFELENQKTLKGNEIITAEQEVFDKHSNIKDIDRLLYSIYNLNRLAHDTIDINLNLEYVPDRFNRHETERKAMSNYIEAYNILHRYGFTIEFIKHILETSPPLKDILLEEVEEAKKTQYANDTKMILMASIRFPFPPSEKDILDINKYFKIISQCNSFTKLEQYAHEQALFFETKTILSEELMMELLTKLDIDVNDIISFSKKEKRDFYQKNGYIIEAQKDSQGNPILVFYSKQFKEPFSIHLKSFNQSLAEGIQKYLQDPNRENTISHFKISPPGMTLRASSYHHKPGTRIRNMQNKIGFCTIVGGIDEEYSAAISNYINYDIHDQIIDQVKNGTFTENTLALLLKDFEEISNDKTKFENSNTNLLRDLYRQTLQMARDEIRLSIAKTSPLKNV